MTMIIIMIVVIMIMNHGILDGHLAMKMLERFFQDYIIGQNSYQKTQNLEDQNGYLLEHPVMEHPFI